MPSGLIALLLAQAALVWSAGWLARYPGVMTPDSADQWNQITSGHFNDWHPVASTLFMKAAASIWSSPAAVVLLQLALMLGLVAAVLSALPALGVSRKGIVVTGVLFAFLPAHVAMLACLWKDIPFSIAFGALTLLLVRLVAKPAPRPGGRSFAALLGLALAVSVLRHNGLPAAVAGLVALGLAQSEWRRPLIQLLILLSCSVALWQCCVRQILHAPGPPAVEAIGTLPLQQVATIVATDPAAVTASQRAQLEAVLPWSVWLAHTSRLHVEELKFHPNFNAAPIRDHPLAYLRLWADLVASHRSLALKAALRQAGVIWHPSFPARDLYLTGIVPNSSGAQPAPPFPGLSAAMQRFYGALDSWPGQFLVNPACAHLLLGLGAVLAAFRGGWRAAVPFVPWAVLTALYVLLLPTPDFRYFYPAFVVLPILLVHVGTLHPRPSATFHHV